MRDEACLYTVFRAPQDHHDRLLREVVAPIARSIRGAPELDSFFFVRYDYPSWQLRFRVLGRTEWVQGPVRDTVETAVEALRGSGLVEAVEFGEYDREWERYGGEEGMRIAEEVFLHDSVAALDLLEAEANDLVGTTRREFSLVQVERLLDLFGFDRDRRIAFYRLGHAAALSEGLWSEDDRARLDAQYAGIRDGLRALVFGAASESPEATYGGPEPARIALRAIDATRPIVERLLAAHAGGRIAQDLVALAWSYAHMHTNRLGIEVPGERILRYFVWRLHTEEERGA